jgi:hypothetical protein
VGLSEDLGPGNLAIDTAIFIYLIEEDVRYLPLILPLFEEADSGKRGLVTSAVTLLGSSAESVGRFRLRELTQRMVQGDF